MTLDQTRAADLEGVHRWRIVYHFHAGHSRSLDQAETIAWFHITADAAWADAAALLPPAGYRKPHAVTVERGTYTRLPEGGYGWQHIGPTQTARVDHTGLTHDSNDAAPEPTPSEHAATLTAAGQQNLF